jgi:hypothetical protein
VLLSNLGRGYALIALRNTLSDMLTGKPLRDWNAYYLMIDRKLDEKDAKDKAAHKARASRHASLARARRLRRHVRRTRPTAT